MWICNNSVDTLISGPFSVWCFSFFPFRRVEFGKRDCSNTIASSLASWLLFSDYLALAMFYLPCFWHGPHRECGASEKEKQKSCCVHRRCEGGYFSRLHPSFWSVCVCYLPWNISDMAMSDQHVSVTFQLVINAVSVYFRLSGLGCDWHVSFYSFLFKVTAQMGSDVAKRLLLVVVEANLSLAKLPRLTVMFLMVL